MLEFASSNEPGTRPVIGAKASNGMPKRLLFSFKIHQPTLSKGSQDEFASV